MHCPKCHTHIPWGEFRCENPDCGKEDAGARVCKTCGGCGWHGDPTEDETKCPACGGTGNIPYCPEGDPECECRSDPCPACNGTGEEESDGDD